MKLTLDIDMSQSKEARVTLNGKTMQGETVLPLIEKLLGEEGKILKDLGAITVHTGPGSYTGLRVGIAVAQMLSALLHIPINGQPPGTPVTPQYGHGDKFAMMDI